MGIKLPGEGPFVHLSTVNDGLCDCCGGQAPRLGTFSAEGFATRNTGITTSSFLLLVVMASNLLAMASNRIASSYW